MSVACNAVPSALVLAGRCEFVCDVRGHGLAGDIGGKLIRLAGGAVYCVARGERALAVRRLRAAKARRVIDWSAVGRGMWAGRRARAK